MIAPLKMYLECQWTLPVLSERIQVESHVCIYVEVIYFVTCESVASCGIPCKILLVLSVGSCVEIYGIEKYIAGSSYVILRTERIIAQELVSDADIKL